MSEPKSALQILVDAKALIDDESRWTRGTSARDVYGFSVDPGAAGAVCFCAYGAVERSSPPEGDSAPGRHAMRFLRYAAVHLFASDVVTVNDEPSGGGHAGVVKMFAAAIEAATLAEQADAEVSP